MASYKNVLQYTKLGFESPAKVFAKLKSKVQHERLCAKDGTFSSNGQSYNDIQKREAGLLSPNKSRAGFFSLTDEFMENPSFAQALTLSPTSSPLKNLRSSKPVENMSPATKIRHGSSPRKGAFLESTAVFQPYVLLSRKQIETGPPQTRDPDDITLCPVNIPPDDVFEYGDCAPIKSSASVFTPMRNRLRKRKCVLANISSSAKEVSTEVINRSQKRKTYNPSWQDDAFNNTCLEERVHVRGISDGRADINQCPFLKSTANKYSNVIMEKDPPMSPAKIFAFMKERENKIERQEVHHLENITRGLFDREQLNHSRDTSPSNVHNMGEQDYITFPESDSESVVPVNWSRVESQPVTLEDPLIFNSPRISIPKKNKAVIKRKPINFPSESVIHLKKWCLKKDRNGLFVEGIHREENIPWNSNIIMDRVSSHVLKTRSGRIYVLVGKMYLNIDNSFPTWLSKKFVNGFPKNWKELYENFVSGSKKDSSKGTDRSRHGRGTMAKKISEASSIMPSVKLHSKNTLKTPHSCPPASSSYAVVSRSGRVIKPPLEYWKGGRVILDAQMNVTIHECYDTSIYNPEVVTAVSVESRRPTQASQPCSNGFKQRALASKKETLAPQRKVKAPVQRRNKSKVSPESKPSPPPQSPVESPNSPNVCPVRRTRSSQRQPSTEMRKTEKSTQRSKGDRSDTAGTSLKVPRHKRTLTESPEALVSDKKSQDETLSEDLAIRRKTWGRRVHRNKPEKLQQKKLPKEREKELPSERERERTIVTDDGEAAQSPQKRNKTSQPIKPLTTKSSIKHQAEKEQEEDEWTDTELMSLKDAVAIYPKHIHGYWTKVAKIVGTRSAKECHHQHTSQETSQPPAKKVNKSKKKKEEAPKVSDHPVISARVGTLKRKQQVRQFLETMPRENIDDIFSSESMQIKRFEVPSMCLSDDHDFTLSDLPPTTPNTTGIPEAKTPNCLYITPGMMGSPNRSNDEKYVYQLQKRMKKSQFNVCKPAPSKSFTPTPSVKRKMKRRGNTENDTFVIREMFPGDNGALSDSEEEKDFYFSDDDNDLI